MSDGCSSGPVVLTLAGPRPFLLVLVLHCPGRVRFFEILAIVPLLSSKIFLNTHIHKFSKCRVSRGKFAQAKVPSISIFHGAFSPRLVNGNLVVPLSCLWEKPVVQSAVEEKNETFSGAPCYGEKPVVQYIQSWGGNCCLFW